MSPFPPSTSLRSPGWRGAALSWAPAAIALLVAVATGWLILTLRERADRARRVQVEIAQIGPDLAVPEQLLARSIELRPGAALPAGPPASGGRPAAALPGGAPAGAQAGALAPAAPAGVVGVPPPRGGPAPGVRPGARPRARRGAQPPDPAGVVLPHLHALQGRVTDPADLAAATAGVLALSAGLRDPHMTAARGALLVGRLERVYAALQQEASAAARSASRLADGGTLALLGLAALAVVVLLRRFERLRMRDAERYAEELRALSLQDPLTGLPNRRQLEHDLAHTTAIATAREPVVLLLFDLDGFKRFNDAFGHRDGDLLLQRLGARLAQAVAPAGTAYRLGGDEFCALLPHAGGAATTTACRAALSERGEGFEISCSCGSATIPVEAQDVEQALRLADERMYADKGARRPSAAPAR